MKKYTVFLTALLFFGFISAMSQKDQKEKKIVVVQEVLDKNTKLSDFSSQQFITIFKKTDKKFEAMWRKKNHTDQTDFITVLHLHHADLSKDAFAKKKMVTAVLPKLFRHAPSNTKVSELCKHYKVDLRSPLEKIFGFIDGCFLSVDDDDSNTSDDSSMWLSMMMTTTDFGSTHSDCGNGGHCGGCD